MSTRSSKTSVLAVGAEPRANLLPPEVAQRKRARAARRGLVALVIGVLLLVAGGYAFASIQAIAAQAELATAQARTGELLAEQLEYSEVTSVSGQLAAATTARQVGTSTEVLWVDVYSDIRDRLPEGTSLSDFRVDGRAPWEPEFTPAGPLRQPRVATVTFTVTSAGPFGVQAFVDEIAEIDGFADATADVFTLADTVYRTTFTYSLGADALSGRFSDEESN